MQFEQAEKQFLPTPASTETSECSRSWLKRNSGASKSGIPSTAQHSTEIVDHCLKLAEQYQLACTGGSDFHGRYGEGETLGCCTAPKTDLHPL